MLRVVVIAGAEPDVGLVHHHLQRGGQLDIMAPPVALAPPPDSKRPRAHGMSAVERSIQVGMGSRCVSTFSMAGAEEVVVVVVVAAVAGLVAVVVAGGGGGGGAGRGCRRLLLVLVPVLALGLAHGDRRGLMGAGGMVWMDSDENARVEEKEEA